eukprot:gene7895-9759_t
MWIRQAPTHRLHLLKDQVMNGFYAAFLTGLNGNSVLLFAIRDRTVVGVDVGGVKYDGSIVEKDAGGHLIHLAYTIAPGVAMITGLGPVAVPTSVSIDFELPAEFMTGVIVRVQTPFGPTAPLASPLDQTAGSAPTSSRVRRGGYASVRPSPPPANPVAWADDHGQGAGIGAVRGW